MPQCSRSLSPCPESERFQWPIVGALIHEYTPIYEELMSEARQTMYDVVAAAVALIIAALVLGLRITSTIALLLSRSWKAASGPLLRATIERGYVCGRKTRSERSRRRSTRWRRISAPVTRDCSIISASSNTTLPSELGEKEPGWSS